MPTWPIGFWFKIKNNFLKKYGSYALVLLGITGLCRSDLGGVIDAFGATSIVKSFLKSKKVILKFARSFQLC